MIYTQSLVDGLAIGSIIALVAIGVTLVFRISHLANASLGDTMTVGAYVTSAFAAVGLPLFLAALCGVAVAAVIGVFSYKVIFQAISARPITMFISSIGFALVLRAVIQLIWGGGVRTFEATALSQVHLGSVVITKADLVAIASCLSVGALFFVLIHKTKTGREIRAVASNEGLAPVKGISVLRVTVIVWAIACGLAAVSGVLLGYTGAILPEMGWDLLLPAFAAAIVGGLGNTNGAVVGGLLIGVVMQFAVIWLPAGYKYGVAFVIMALVLTIRPTGIMPRRVRI